MTIKNPDSILLVPPGLERLNGFASNLNTELTSIPIPMPIGWRKARIEYRPVQQELRRLVQAWFDSGPNVENLLGSDPALAKAAWNFRAHLVASKGAQARLIYDPTPDEISPRATALGLFFDFLLNPYNQKLGGPCKHCNAYYLKKTKRQNVYCSKRCGLRHTSQTAIREQRGLEHMRTLERAKEFGEMWAKTKTSKSWKEWVSARALISKHWLTRAVRRGELSTPLKNATGIRSAD